MRRRVGLVALLRPDSQSGADWRWTMLSHSVCGRIRMSHAPEMLHFGRFAFRSARHPENIADAAHLSQIHDQLHFIRNTVSLFCCGVSWQTKPSRTMATILNSVHLDCSWETSYSQPFVPTWSAMLHVPQGNAAGQCYHLPVSSSISLLSAA